MEDNLKQKIKDIETCLDFCIWAYKHPETNDKKFWPRYKEIEDLEYSYCALCKYYHISPEHCIICQKCPLNVKGLSRGFACQEYGGLHCYSVWRESLDIVHRKNAAAFIAAKIRRHLKKIYKQLGG